MVKYQNRKLSAYQSNLLYHSLTKLDKLWLRFRDGTVAYSC